MIPVPDLTEWTDTAGGAWQMFGADITVSRGELAGMFTVAQIGGA